MEALYLREEDFLLLISQVKLAVRKLRDGDGLLIATMARDDSDREAGALCRAAMKAALGNEETSIIVKPAPWQKGS